jgi:cytochrome c biogenesis protein CcdA
MGSGVVHVIDMQLLNDALLAVAFAAGMAILLAVAIVGAERWSRRHERAGVREIEQHLAAVAEQRSSASTR